VGDRFTFQKKKWIQIEHLAYPLTIWASVALEKIRATDGNKLD